MIEKVTEAIKNDKNIQRMLAEYIIDFIKKYNDLNRKQKDSVLFSKDSIFRKWLYSAVSSDTYLNPNFLVNQLAQEKVPGKYAVSPHVNIEEYRGKLRSSISYIFYSIEKHPVLDDLDKLMDFADPTIIVRENNKYLIDNGEKLLEKINFRSAYYLEYLMYIATSMKFLVQMKSIGCTCFKIGDQYDEFMKLSNKEKLLKVIDTSINFSFNNLNDSEVFIEDFDRKRILSLIDNNINFDNYIENIDGLEDEILDAILEQYPGEENENIKMAAQTGAQLYYRVFIDMYFTSVFGYYLGLISPNKSNIFIMKQVFNEFAEDEDPNDRLRIIFECDDLHDLTPFGEEIISQLKPHQNKRFFKHIKSSEFSTILESAEKEKKLDEKMYDILESNNGTGNEEFINSHLNKFAEYLLKDKILKQSTVESHISNVYMFLNFYVKCKNKNDLQKIDDKLVDNYMREFYIPIAASSKTDTKNELVSIGRYAEFLYKTSIIDGEDIKAIKKVVKNKIYYEEIFVELNNN
ncbi:hypothetical protein [Inconstantimicrobium porci]|uniref:Uncharacterized protein n=1 Tax=Inconstantimicrobium porci TaxID=2652291 RepID=A0A7X2N163_9CLOT|nr:hypothetical protein [Inconstantimicrobium porci]MSR92360.1 hypothetical protein [Inconstantimicrobium porci]